MDRVVLDCELLLMPLERGEDVWLLGLVLDYMKLLNGGSALLLTGGLLLAQMKRFTNTLMARQKASLCCQ